MDITKTVPNRNSPPAILLRESVRDGSKVRKRTLANLSSWPPSQIESLRYVLKGHAVVPRDQALQIIRSLPHGHVAAVLQQNGQNREERSQWDNDNRLAIADSIDQARYGPFQPQCMGWLQSVIQRAIGSKPAAVAAM